MTSQLFKPNLGMESVRTEGSVTEVQDGDASPAGQVETLSPETTNVPLFESRELSLVPPPFLPLLMSLQPLLLRSLFRLQRF